MFARQQQKRQQLGPEEADDGEFIPTLTSVVSRIQKFMVHGFYEIKINQTNLMRGGKQSGWLL